MKISWMDKISNEEVLARVNEMRTMLNIYGQETLLDRTCFAA